MTRNARKRKAAEDAAIILWGMNVPGEVYPYVLFAHYVGDHESDSITASTIVARVMDDVDAAIGGVKGEVRA